jgi:hypothetical protein
MKIKRVALLGVCMLLLLSGCTYQLTTKQVDLSTVSAPEVWVLTDTIKVRLDNLYAYTLQKGTRFKYVGDLPEGQVMKQVDRVFTIEGTHVHEAYLVNSQGELAGFYLPGLDAYSPLKKRVSLPLTKE